MLGSANIIAFVPTKNTERARKFYDQTLGLRFVSDDGFALVFDANGVMVRVVRVQEFAPAPYTILGWEVQNIEEVVAKLTQNGIQFERYGFFKQDDLGIWTAPSGARVAWFKDPDGNTLSVSGHKSS